MHIPFLALFFFLDVLHPITPSANSTPSTDSSHPTQGWYPSLGVSPACAIQGALPLFLSIDVLHPSTPIADSTPSTDSSHPTQGWYHYLGVSPFCALQGASPSWALPFSHTPTAPRGYSLNRVPHSYDSPLNVCEMSLNQNFLHLGVPRMHSGPSLAWGKHVAFIHYPHHHFLMVKNLCAWYFSHIFLTHYSSRALALLRATISHACNHSTGGKFIILLIQRTSKVLA